MAAELLASMENLDELESENSKLKGEILRKTEEIVQLRYGIHRKDLFWVVKILSVDPSFEMKRLKWRIS